MKGLLESFCSDYHFCLFYF